MDEIMTLNEVADYLKIASKTVTRMIQRKEIPCFKISGQWRFKKKAIDTWLDMKMNSPKFESIYTQEELSFFPLYKLINEDSIVFDIKGKTNKEILEQLTNPLKNNGNNNIDDQLIDNLLKREEMAPTTLKNGVAFPHCRKPEENKSDLPPIILGISKNGVEFNSKNNQKTYLFFLILVNDEVTHLKILSKLANFINRENIIEKLKNMNNEKEIIKFLMESEYEHMA